MFTSLEGKAKRNYQACDEKGDLSGENPGEDEHDIRNFRILPGPECQVLWAEAR